MKLTGIKRAPAIHSSSASPSPLSRSHNSIFTNIASSTPYSALLSRRCYPPSYFFNSAERGNFPRKVELKSTGIGGSSVIIKNRRVQTRSGSTMIDQEPIIDTHSLDGSGSPGGDSGVFSSSADKYEIIQKDIGYSSDADMSDAIEVSPVYLT